MLSEIGTGLASDAVLLLFSVAGLLATTIAIVRDTAAQRSELAREAVSLDHRGARRARRAR
ncbi:MAG: hypothetical protein ACRDF0_09020 [Candidatus Limnocylindria bacterium]